MRARDGTVIDFDPPGSQYTFVAAINPEGAITGSYQDVSLVNHGFLRSRGGTFTTFDAPNSIFQTNAGAINPAGAITGDYQEASAIHGFLRAPDGTFTTIDPVDSVDTFPAAINPAGAITGSYDDASALGHGFLFLPRP